MSPAPHVSPRVRAYGKARIDITRRAQDEEEWRRLWKEPAQAYPFTSGEGWKFNLVYTVEDFAAEIGFLIDVLGFPVLSFSPSQAQLTAPQGGFALTILAAREDRPSTLPEALHLQLNVEGIKPVVRELERRGITFDQLPAPIQAGSAWQSASFRTPHGVTIELMSEEPLDNASAETGQSGGDDAHLQALDEEQIEPEETTVDEISDMAETGDDDTEEPGVQPEPHPASEPHKALWPRMPGGLGRLTKTKPQSVKSAKPGNGNTELTYDALDEDSTDGEGVDIDEDFP